MDWDELTPDDIVLVDDLEEEIDEIMSDKDTGADPDLPEDIVSHDEAAQTAERKSFDIIEHIVSDDCDNEQCNHIREELENRFGSELQDDAGDSGGNDDSDEPDDQQADEGEGSDEGTDGDGDDGFNDPADDLPFEVDK